MPVGPLPVAMIEPAFGTYLVTPVGAPPLPQPRVGTAGEAAITLSAVAMETKPEHGVTGMAEANPLPNNDFAVILHLPSRAGVDNGKGFVSG